MRDGPAGIPTARRVDHVAVTVPDLDAAVKALVDGIGGQLVYRLAPLSHADDWMAEHLDVHPRAVASIALVRLGPLTNVELFEYRSPDHNPVPPRPADVGFQYLGLFTDDIAATVSHLAQRGFHPHGKPWVAPGYEPDAGTVRVRLLSDCGVNFEVRHAPPHLPYEQAGTARRCPPCPRWTSGPGTESAPPVPGLRSVDHIGHTVDDLEGSVAFFVDMVGAELLYGSGWRDLAADDRASSLGVAEDGRIRTATLRLGPTDNLELREFDVPGARRRPPRNSDVGGRHLAIAVQDVDAAAAYMARVGGCTVLGAPETVLSGPIAGDRWVYVRTPIGLHLELVNMPDGQLPYERDTVARRRSASGFAWWDR